MFSAFLCLPAQHDERLVGLAAVICVSAMIAAIVFLRGARRTGERAQVILALTAGAITGFGIWATHFVAILGYDPGIVVGFEPVKTILSLLLAMVLTATGFLIALRRSDPLSQNLAGVAVGAGIVAMHYTGMAAVTFPGRFEWDGGLVSLSVLLAILPSAAALRLALARRDRASGFVAAGLLTLGVVSLHFTGMAAVQPVVAEPADHENLLSPLALGIALTGAFLLVVIVALAAVILNRRFAEVRRESEMELDLFAKRVTDCAIYMLDAGGRIRNWNAGAKQMKQYAERQALGMHFGAFYTAIDRAADVPGKALAIARMNGHHATEGWRLRADGTQFWAHVTIEAVHDDDGNLRGYANITRDMTALKQEQTRLATVTRRLDEALSHMTDGLCLFDADHRLVLSNSRFAELWGLPPLACRPGISVIELGTMALSSRTGTPPDPARVANMRSLLEASLADPASPPVIMAFGDELTLAITSRSLPDGGFVTTFQDVTALNCATTRLALLDDAGTNNDNIAHAA